MMMYVRQNIFNVIIVIQFVNNLKKLMKRDLTLSLKWQLIDMCPNMVADRSLEDQAQGSPESDEAQHSG